MFFKHKEYSLDKIEEYLEQNNEMHGVKNENIKLLIKFLFYIFCFSFNLLSFIDISTFSALDFSLSAICK